ncbi:MAG: prenyltransferase [Actinomycetota bacterium]|nr:prenyltransferase [Actinomycetota bacterium]
MLEVVPALTRVQLDQTVQAIGSVQARDGAIPELPGGVTNPWNHVEAAMALDVGGCSDAATRAYEWLARTQQPDGSWAAGYLGSEIVDHTRDSNFSSYVAFGSWHHFLATGDRCFLELMWPVIERALEFTLALQLRTGAIAWARDARGTMWPSALLTSCSCIYMSIRSALLVAAALGRNRPEWELTLATLGKAIRGAGSEFQPKDRFSMDWYYPVLARVVQGAEARLRLNERWESFVIRGRGVRCVSDRPWVTAGETAELVLALWVAGLHVEANMLLEWVQHLREDDGAYWIGATFPDGTVWPRQKPTWGSGAVVLAADALAGGITARCL